MDMQLVLLLELWMHLKVIGSLLIVVWLKLEINLNKYRFMPFFKEKMVFPRPSLWNSIFIIN